MQNDTPAVVHLADYMPPPYWVSTVHLDIDIRPEGTCVSATLSCTRNLEVVGEQPLVLNGSGEWVMVKLTTAQAAAT